MSSHLFLKQVKQVLESRVSISLEKREGIHDFHYYIFFPNGYGISVFYFDYYAALELAVLKGNKESFQLDYTTPITDDILRTDDIEEFIQILQDVSNLEANLYDELKNMYDRV